MIEKEILIHHMECLQWKLKYKVHMVDSEYESMAKHLKTVIEILESIKHL